MGKENSFGMMGIYIKANLKMIKEKEMVNLHSKTEKFTKVNLKMEITMVLENLYSIVETDRGFGIEMVLIQSLSFTHFI